MSSPCLLTPLRPSDTRIRAYNPRWYPAPLPLHTCHSPSSPHTPIPLCPLVVQPRTMRIDPISFRLACLPLSLPFCLRSSVSEFDQAFSPPYNLFTLCAFIHMILGSALCVTPPLPLSSLRFLGLPEYPAEGHLLHGRILTVICHQGPVLTQFLLAELSTRPITVSVACFHLVASLLATHRLVLPCNPPSSPLCTVGRAVL